MSLFEPLVFRGGAVAPNRVFLAAMTNGQSLPDGRLGDDELRWLARRADGGFGVIATCAAHVAQDGKSWAGELGVHDDGCVPGLARLAERVQDGGALGMVQLFHGGVRAPSWISGSQPWSATSFVEDAPGFEVPRAASAADIARVIDQFAAAARRCARAGWRGVELHGAHGYLLCQFLSRTMNTRDDEWGGAAIERRARLIREVMRAVRAAAPAPFVVGVRLSPEDFGQAKGLDLDESVQVARWLVEDGADFIHLSLWRAHEMTKKDPQRHAVEIFRAALPASVKIAVAGALWTRADADAMLARGADAIALARAAIANPDWPRRAIDPSWEPRRPPLSAAELMERALSPVFVGYMRRWKNFVSD
ncbi:MAG TPA: NADH:flavin oxidoreductase [Kofleriaceae bacterium]|nr:NADH:flavin oxidoreductase [Kofleriaceae bacterium]